MRSSGAWLLLIAIAALGACASPSGEIVLADEESFDGLRRVENTRAHRVWIRPDLDLSGYDAMILRGAEIEYRPVVGGRGAGGGPSSRAAFPVGPSAQERLANMASEIFREELATSKRFRITDSEGPNVLIVEGTLIDVVSYVPPETGRSDSFISRVGEATLVIQVSDSGSKAVLARVVDRRAAQDISGGQRSTTVTNQAEMRRLLRRWARQLREGLDSLPDHTPAADGSSSSGPPSP